MSETNPKAPEGAIAIAEKWREVRRQCIEFLARPGEPSAKPIEWCVQLIDDLTSLTQRAELAESRVKELSKPVTDAPIIDTRACSICGQQTVYSCVFDRLPLCGNISCREEHEKKGECTNGRK